MTSHLPRILEACLGTHPAPPASTLRQCFVFVQSSIACCERIKLRTCLREDGGFASWKEGVVEVCVML
jgi:hypothetical protein